MNQIIKKEKEEIIMKKIRLAAITDLVAVATSITAMAGT